jgi:hypothetical protein
VNPSPLATAYDAAGLGGFDPERVARLMLALVRPVNAAPLLGYARRNPDVIRDLVAHGAPDGVLTVLASLAYAGAGEAELLALLPAKERTA